MILMIPWLVPESAWARRFGALLEASDDFTTPAVHDDFTTRNILAMSYAPGTPIDALGGLPQEERDRIATALIDLSLRELLRHRMMQTDPNFANFLYEEETGKIILLDFGAARDIEPALAEGYRALLAAALWGDWSDARNAARSMGLIDADTPAHLEHVMRETFDIAMEPMRRKGSYDFGASYLATRLRDSVLALRTSGFHQPPPPAAMFIHRKLGGLYLIATKLRARVDVNALVSAHAR